MRNSLSKTMKTGKFQHDDIRCEPKKWGERKPVSVIFFLYL